MNKRQKWTRGRTIPLAREYARLEAALSVSRRKNIPETRARMALDKFLKDCPVPIDKVKRHVRFI